MGWRYPITIRGYRLFALAALAVGLLAALLLVVGGDGRNVAEAGPPLQDPTPTRSQQWWDTYNALMGLGAHAQNITITYTTTSTSISLSWGSVSNAVGYCAVAYANTPSQYYMHAAQKGVGTTALLAGLTPGSTYIVRVVALNTAGNNVSGCNAGGNWSDYAVALANVSGTIDVGSAGTITLPGQSAPCAGALSGPSALAIGASGSISLSMSQGSVSSVSWTASAGTLSGTSNSGATIRAPSSGSGTITVTASISCSGSGSPTNTATLSISYGPGVPDAVSGLLVTSTSQTAISIIWTEPANNGSPITGYSIRRRKNTSPVGSWTTRTTSSTSYTITGLDSGTPYEIQVRATNNVGSSITWSESLFRTTDADLFAQDPPDNVEVSDNNSSDTLVSVRISWNPVKDATGYQIERAVLGVLAYYTTTQTDYYNTYNRTPSASGNIFYRVRAYKTASGNTTYTDWSARGNFLYYAAGDVDAPDVLAQEIAGNRPLPQGITDTREGLADAMDEVGDAAGVEVDTDGALNLLATLPSIIILGFSAAAGLKYRQIPIALAFGSVLGTLTLLPMSNILGYDIIWPILITVGLVALGIITFARKMGWLPW